MNQILPGFADCKLSRPVALVSGHPDKAKEQAAKYGIDPRRIYSYENFDTIRDNPEVDVVYVVLPNSMHAEYTIRAARAGKHVLCEKPMATSVDDCRRMIDACKQAGKKLQIGYRLHYEPNTLALIDAVRKNECGGLKSVLAEAGFNIGDPAQWRLKKSLSGGGCLMDIGIYALQAARYVSGEEPVEVSAFTYADTSDPRFKEVEESLQLPTPLPRRRPGDVPLHLRLQRAQSLPRLLHQGVRRGRPRPQLPRRQVPHEARQGRRSPRPARTSTSSRPRWTPCPTPS